VRKCYGPLHKGAEIDDDAFSNPRAKACRLCFAQYSKARYARDKERLKAKSKEWKSQHRQELQEKNRAYYLANSQSCRANVAKWMNSIENRIWHRAVNRIRSAMRGYSCDPKLLLGCDKKTLFFHLASQFKPGMGEKNFGKGPLKWVIGSVNQFDLGTKDGQLKAFHFTNLKPVWWKRVKG